MAFGGGWGGRGLSLGRSRRALAGTTRWPRPRPGGRCMGTRRRDGPPGCALRSRSRSGWKLCPEREAEPTEQAAWGGGGSPLPAGARRGCLAAPRGPSPGGGGAGRSAFGAPAATSSHGSYAPPRGLPGTVAPVQKPLPLFPPTTHAPAVAPGDASRRVPCPMPSPSPDLPQIRRLPPAFSVAQDVPFHGPPSPRRGTVVLGSDPHSSGQPGLARRQPPSPVHPRI